ncbi:apolipoprotein L3-like [Polymixia lowei]
MDTKEIHHINETRAAETTRQQDGSRLALMETELEPQSDPATKNIKSEIMKSSKETIEDLQANLDKLRTLADGLENIHRGTTIGSLTGGVIGAVGGVTSIVGLILAPFTLGVSLVVTGIGVGVAVAGGATAGISNITNVVNQSTDRQAVRSIIKEFSEKMNSVVTTLQEISEGLEELRQNADSPDFEGSGVNAEVLRRAGARVGRGVGGISELVRLVQVVRLGKVAAQTARIVRVAEVATGVLSGLFVAVDVFFIAMDAKEIHQIKQARAAEMKRQQDASRQVETDSASELEPQSDPATKNIKSETMKFVVSIRQTVEKLQEIVDELSKVTSDLP